MQQFWIIGLLSLFIGRCLAADLKVEEILSQCCTVGEDLATSEQECTNFKSPEVPAVLMSACFFSSEICCTSKLRIDECKRGVLAARDGGDCHGKNKTGSDLFKSCCEACKIGLVVGSIQEKCSLGSFTYGQPLDDSYAFCCNDMKAGDSFVLTDDDKDICSKFDRLCSQICENTDDSYVCRCHPGYQLLEDKITCVAIKDATENNEVLQNSTDSDCRIGFTKNEASGECEDIDECEGTDVSCNIETQVCYNIPGSYKCLDVMPAVTSCPEGFQFNAKSKQCDDYNECITLKHNCTEKENCVNTYGGYYCQYRDADLDSRCTHGFIYDKKTNACRDINECQTKLAVLTCGNDKTCVNTPGGFECIDKKTTVKPAIPFENPKKKITCSKGFKQYLDKCVDIDECIADRNACDSNQNCINTLGSFQCECKTGFSMDKVVNACVDINECQINNHDCLETQRCDNTIGSYTCIRLQSCGTGYTLNAATGYCDDDDECILGTHNCVLPYECRNTKGSFRCDKPRYTTTKAPPPPTTTTTQAPPPSTPTQTSGSTRSISYSYIPPQVYTQSYSRFIVSPTSPLPSNVENDRRYGPCSGGFERNSQGACVDVDECYVGNPCRRNQRCINSNGSYKCQNLLTCSGGYTSNDEGTQCIDIDECATGVANCGPDEICRNKPGGYTCSCPAGHQLNAQRRCEDINECEFYRGQVCPGNTDCVNSIGSYRCDCKQGFKKQNTDDKVCVDVDECAEIPGLCAQRCINYWGSYKCACESGYRLSESNNRSCDDIDECEVHKSYNLCMGSCENTQGSYQCTCPAGYRLGADGRTCQDIDECATQQVCRNSHEICTNLKGSYRCTYMKCPPEYIVDPEHKNRCKRVSLICDHSDIDCFRKPTSYGYNFITLVSNLSVPPNGRGLFTYRGPSWYESIDFDLKIINSQAPSNVRKVHDGYFSLQKMHNEALLSLMQSIEGPQDIELELSMTVFRDGQPGGTTVARLFIFVSEYQF